MEKYTYNKIGMARTVITREPTDEGESIEEMLRRCTESNEPIEATAPMIYTEKNEGVKPEYDIRTDRFELALEAVDKYQKAKMAKSTETPKEEQAKKETTKEVDNNG